MKYIFVVGAPGSKWSSVVKNIYFSKDIDTTDYSEYRLYYHDASGKYELMHLGAYFDPGMEFGDYFDCLDQYTKEYNESEFDRPFNGIGIKIVKSHVFANHINYIKKTWPDCPVILVYRNDDSCLGWWVKCGHFNITYPKYDKYYKDLKTMSKIITEQNKHILSAMFEYKGEFVENNIELSKILSISNPPKEYFQDYVKSDIKVKVI